MAVNKVRPGEIVVFYAILISTKNHNPQYTIELKNEWLNKPMLRQSYFVTHIMSFFKLKDVYSSHNVFVKSEYFDKILEKTFYSIFDVEIEF